MVILYKIFGPSISRISTDSVVVSSFLYLELDFSFFFFLPYDKGIFHTIEREGKKMIR